jgi:hypothetical protein
MIILTLRRNLINVNKYIDKKHILFEMLKFKIVLRNRGSINVALMCQD